MELPELPECPVCLQNYDGASTIPRVLGCGHSACEVCLAKLPLRYPETIRFPACTQLVKYPPNGAAALPKNIDLLSLSLSPSLRGKTLTLSHVSNPPMTKCITSCPGFGPMSFTARGRIGFLETTPFWSKRRKWVGFVRVVLMWGWLKSGPWRVRVWVSLGLSLATM
ncbi:hypothetical protein ACLB2K_014464 [Fragaria x ananassa]